MIAHLTSSPPTIYYEYIQINRLHNDLMAISVSVRPDQEFSPDWNWTIARSKILAGKELDLSKIGRDLILPSQKSGRRLEPVGFSKE